MSETKEEKLEKNRRWNKLHGDEYRTKNRDRIKAVKLAWYVQTRERRLEVKRAWRSKNIEKQHAKEAEFRDRHRERLRVYAREWSRNNLHKTRYLGLKKKYGITRTDYESMVKEQNGVCAICHRPPSEKQRWLDVDHDHATGKVRALLCHNCNLGLGNFQDSLEFLRHGATYIKYWSTFDEIAA